MNIMIVGVGGQGTLLCSRLLGEAFVAMGREVKVSEVHGMSQRGGSVVTYVKCGDEVFSPLVERGEADLILAFEQLEAARWLPYLSPGGRMLVNTQIINPMPVITGAAQYPEGILDWLTANVPGSVTLDALKLAEEAGSPRAVNTVLVGAMVAVLNLPKDVFETALEKTVPPKFLKLNKIAFEKGFAAVSR
ncbi:MAG: indolepyruvate oxidoreductase subunit beta [Oscillospiraceae bacterium]|jgi:indolepyruvate ferredoxin oxidoreductase beta subunit|nr:indolepyruvate oxidoreductase subunit beta [Oscillospiraceae bacterium]